jgi:AcrR family transcriptional regulator
MPIPRTSPSHPRKRPRQGRSINTVDAILEAAARLLERDGFAGFNTNVIAALAGVSTGSLYQYYPDKEAILRALVVTSVQARAALAVGAIREHAGPGALAAALEAALAHAQERPVLTRQLAFAEPLVLVAEHDQEIAEELLNWPRKDVRQEAILDRTWRSTCPLSVAVVIQMSSSTRP